MKTALPNVMAITVPASTPQNPKTGASANVSATFATAVMIEFDATSPGRPSLVAMFMATSHEVLDRYASVRSTTTPGAWSGTSPSQAFSSNGDITDVSANTGKARPTARRV